MIFPSTHLKGKILIEMTDFNALICSSSVWPTQGIHGVAADFSYGAVFCQSAVNGLLSFALNFSKSKSFSISISKSYRPFVTDCFRPMSGVSD